jgi:hypothetical protein
VAVLALATLSAGFSITGIRRVRRRVLAVDRHERGLGVPASSSEWHGRRGGSSVVRAALILLVAVPMVLSAIGANGFPAKGAHRHGIAGEAAMAGRTAEIDARITAQARIIADIDRRIAQNRLGCE